MSTLNKLLLCLIPLVFYSCNNPTSTRKKTIFQNSTFSALLQGDYEGKLTIGEISKSGGFGLGTFNNIDGELIALDGVYYTIETSGRLTKTSMSTKSPFAAVTNFDAKSSQEVSNVRSYGDFFNTLDRSIENVNTPYAVKVTGKFSSLHLRSLKRMEKPFPNFTEATKQQHEYTLEEVEGTLVGFWFPDYLSGINVPGFHFHFMTKDKMVGGHVLGLSISRARAEFMPIEDLTIHFPQTKAFSMLNLEGNHTETIKQVEQRH